ncbi:MAG: hypothetical protein R3F11_27680 [Verrucomicrobiales bacterium]
MYTSLSPDKLSETIDRFCQRIEKVFPLSGLNEVAKEVRSAAGATIERTRAINRPNWCLRIGVAVGVMALLIAPALVWLSLELPLEFGNIAEFVEATDAGIHMLLVLAGGALFLISAERRARRNKALNALKELRSLAHVIDMHQLSKDPGMKAVELDGDRPRARPRAVNSPEDLRYYLDFSSDLLAVLAKLAAMYAEVVNDRDVLVAVNEIEQLTNAIARNIWQKMSLVS